MLFIDSKEFSKYDITYIQWQDKGNKGSEKHYDNMEVLDIKSDKWTSGEILYISA